MRSFSAILLCVAALAFTVSATSEPLPDPVPVKPHKLTDEEIAEFKKGREEVKTYCSKATGFEDVIKDNPEIENFCLNYSTSLKSLVIAVKSHKKPQKQIYLLKDGKFKQCSKEDITNLRKEIMKSVGHRHHHHGKGGHHHHHHGKDEKKEEPKKEEPKPEEPKKEEPKPEEPKPEEKKDESYGTAS